VRSMREILVEVDEDGKVTVKTQGYAGPSCVEALKRLMERLKALGIDSSLEKQQLTPEYYKQTQTAKTRIQEG